MRLATFVLALAVSTAAHAGCITNEGRGDMVGMIVAVSRVCSGMNPVPDDQRLVDVFVAFGAVPASERNEYACYIEAMAATGGQRIVLNRATRLNTWLGCASILQTLKSNPAVERDMRAFGIMR